MNSPPSHQNHQKKSICMISVGYYCMKIFTNVSALLYMQMSKKLLTCIGKMTIVVIILSIAWILLSMFIDENHHKIELAKIMKLQKNKQYSDDVSLNFDKDSGTVIVGDSSTFQKLYNTEVNEMKQNNNMQIFNSDGSTIVYPLLIKAAPLSKDLVIHRVYYDHRKRDGFQNATVFFIDASFSILQNDWIIGCGTGDILAAHYRVSIYAGWWGSLHLNRQNRFFKYEHLYVHCYDLPAKEGDKAFLIYKTGEFSSQYVVESEQPLTVPAPKVHTQYQNTSISVATCFNANTKHAMLMKENIVYQKYLGVDHVTVTATSVYLKEGGVLELVKNPEIYDLVRKGYLTFDIWKQWYNSIENRDWGVSLKKTACVYQYLGTYDFALSFDSDDFFNPRVPGEGNIKYYLKRFFYNVHIGSCWLFWIKYHPEYCGLNAIPSNGNVTAALKSYVHDGNLLGKSIHRTEAIIDATSS